MSDNFNCLIGSQEASLNEHVTTTPKKTIMVDVDGVLFEYNGWKGIDHFGDPIKVNIDLVNALYDSGEYEICIWTTRTNDLVQGYPKQVLKDMITQKLEEAGIKYHRISDENKPLFKLMIDDNTFNPDPLKRIEIGDMLRLAVLKWFKDVLSKTSVQEVPSKLPDSK